MLLYVRPYKHAAGIPVFGTGIDPFFENVVSLMHMNDAGLTDTVAGNSWSIVNGGSIVATPTKFGTGAYNVPSSGRPYLKNINSAMVVGTNDFTIEMFVYPNTVGGSYQHIYSSIDASTFMISILAGKINIYCNGIWRDMGNIPITAGGWHHVAICRHNGILYAFLDGAMCTNAFAYTGEITSSSTCCLGSQPVGGSTYEFNGVIDEFRLTKNIVRYMTGGFTPTTTAFTDGRDDTVDPFLGYVLFGMHCNGTVGTNPTTDWGTTVATNSAGTQPVIATGGKFGNCLNFAGWKSLDYTTFLLNLDFTLEFWVNPVGSSAGTKRTLFSIGGSTANNLGFLIGINDSNRLELVLNSSPESSSTSITSGTWYHVALTRSGNNFCAYVNGVSVITVSANPSAGSFAYLGRQVFSTSGYGYYNGLMDEIRLTQRVARYGYGKSFVAPTAAFPDTFETSYDPYANQVVYNMPFDSNVNSTVKGYSGTQSGGQLSAGKFGNCFEKAAATDQVLMPSGRQNVLYNRAFTIDFWVNYSNPVAADVIVFGTKINSPNRSYAVRIQNGGTVIFDYSTTGSDSFTKAAVPAISLNAWHHIAICRHSTLGFGIFIDGVLTGGWTASSATISSSLEARIGGFADVVNTYPGGYGLKIDDFRLTVGICRYTNNFIPQVAANKTA